MRAFARGAGPNLTFATGSVVFNKGDAGNCMYVVQSGVIEMVIGDKVVETVGPNEAIGFMSMVDSATKLDCAGEESLRAFGDRRPHLPFHGGRNPELRPLRDERNGPPHSRHGPGDEIG